VSDKREFRLGPKKKNKQSKPSKTKRAKQNEQKQNKANNVNKANTDEQTQTSKHETMDHTMNGMNEQHID